MKVASDLGKALNTLETGLGSLATANPLFQTAKGAVNLGGRVSSFASGLGGALESSTLEEASEKLAPLIKDAYQVYSRAREAPTKSGFFQSELERG